MSDEKIFVEKKKGISVIAIICIIVISAVLSSVITYKLLDKKSEEKSVAGDRGEIIQSTKYEIESVDNPVIAVAKECSSAIVGIDVETLTPNLFGILQNAKSSGSGIVYSGDGYIITNYHVVEDAVKSTSSSSITVTLLDKTEYAAKIVGSDQYSDLAVLKIDAPSLKVAKLGDSSSVEVGQLAIAIGNPLGQTLAGSVTVGYISALDRSITVNGVTNKFIQTDAAINSGNSGGALLNDKGEVIGINNIKAYSTGVEGLGFAIPINTAKPIIEELIKSGKVVRPYIGISGFDLTESMAKKYDLVKGVYVQEVEEGKAASNAGIKQGDVIIKIDDKEISTFDELNDYKNSKKVGDEVTITVYRNGKEEKLKVVIGEN